MHRIGSKGIANVIETSCHCGDVRVSIPRLPETVTSCNCSLCYRIGALWAYFTRGEVTIERPAEGVEYSWGDRCMVIHSCGRCGSTTHYESVDEGPEARVAVNMRMAPRALAESVPVRHFDGADSWTFID